MTLRTLPYFNVAAESGVIMLTLIWNIRNFMLIAAGDIIWSRAAVKAAGKAATVTQTFEKLATLNQMQITRLNEI